MGIVQTLEPGEFTMADLDALPDDGMRYELVDGMLLVTPAPRPIHQTAVLQLGSRLLTACPPELKVFVAPLDYRPTAQRSLQPDVLVCRKEDVGVKAIEQPLLLAVEILSPSTRMTDLLLKRGLYQEAGVTSYWIFDPANVELTVLELSGGHYVQQTAVRDQQPFQAELPFPIRFVPADLVD